MPESSWSVKSEFGGLPESGASLNADSVDQDDVIDANVAPIGNRLYRRLATGSAANSQSVLPSFVGFFMQ